MNRLSLIGRATLIALGSLALSGCGEEDDAASAPPPPEIAPSSIDHAAEVAALGGDPERGERLFRFCASCHQIDAPAHRTGPHLIGLFGRQAGVDPTFDYSEASQSSGVVWRVETLRAYLTDPRGFMPGTKMVYAGMKAERLPDLIAYLYQQGGEAPSP